MVTEASCPSTGTGSTKTVSTEQQGTAIRFCLCTQVSSGYLPHSIVEGASRFRLDPWRTKTNPRHSNISENADSQHETTNNQIPKHNSPHSFIQQFINSSLLQQIVFFKCHNLHSVHWEGGEGGESRFAFLSVCIV